MTEMIFVIGSGRSGTSLAAQMLGKLGGRISDELVPVGEQNPDGAYEDKFVFETISKLMRELGATHNLPMPQGWLEAPATRACINALVDKVGAELQREGGPWVLKEPRSAILIPMWRQVFNRTKVAPKYVLTVRNPKDVCVSAQKQYGEPVAVTELMWLNKYVSSLSELGGSCFLLHYEDWFGQPVETARELAEFAGLTPDSGELERVVGETVKARLNRSGFQDAELNNPYVNGLYRVLRMGRGLEYARDELKQALAEAVAAMSAFAGWVDLYHAKRVAGGGQSGGQLAEALKREAKLLSQIEQANAKKQSLTMLATQASLAKREAASIREHNERLKSDIALIKKKNGRLQRSTAYQLGLVFTGLAKSPLKGLFMLPVNLLRVLKRRRARA